tara:strand:+ start:222 stop:449 length:228 start_codon:yes stop_codon:yes gene_type:complete
MAKNKIMTKVGALVDFIKTQTINDLVTARDKKVFSLGDEELRKLSFVVQASIEKSFNLGSNELVKYAEKIKEPKK